MLCANMYIGEYIYFYLLPSTLNLTGAAIFCANWYLVA